MLNFFKNLKLKKKLSREELLAKEFEEGRYLRPVKEDNSNGQIS